MSMPDLARAAALLAEAWSAGTRLAALPDESAPRDEAEAYRAQAALSALLGPVGGWKIGAASAEATPFAAPLPASCLSPSPARLPAGAARPLMVEVELAFRLGATLAPRDAPYSPDEIAAAIDAAVTTIELVDSRLAGWPDAPKPWQLADLQNHGRLILGAAQLGWRDLDFTRPAAHLAIDGVRVAERHAPHPAGDPLRLVAWLINAGPAKASGLAAGTVLTLGSLTPPHPVPGAGAVCVGTLDGVGAAEVMV